MREMTATEVARNFASVLDEVEANGAAINQLAARWAGHIGLDDEFERAVTEIREESRTNRQLDTDPWHD